MHPCPFAIGVPWRGTATAMKQGFIAWVRIGERKPSGSLLTSGERAGHSRRFAPRNSRTAVILLRRRRNSRTGRLFFFHIKVSI